MPIAINSPNEGNSPDLVFDVHLSLDLPLADLVSLLV